MYRCLLLVVLWMSLSCPARAATADDAACAAAARAAEQQFGIPAGLLDAIGRVESGRGGVPWPWTINADGAGSFFESRADAATQIARLQTRGARLIDVGCFQVDLFWHPDAFTSIDDALDPARNAQEAARFLADLHRQTSDWSAAVARYHSADPTLGLAYRNRVLGGDPAGIEARDVRVFDPFVVVLARTTPHRAPVLPNVIRATFR